MKLTFKNNKIIIYLNKVYIHSLNLSDEEEINSYTKKIIRKLEKNYHIKLNGFYTINMYLDDNYGIIMEIIGEEDSYLDYFTNTLDVNIKIYKDSFLYEVNNINKNDDYNIYTYNNHIYIKFKKTFSNNFMIKFIEKVIDIKYGIEKDLILKNLKVLG